MSVLGFAAFMLAAIPVFWMKLGVLMSAFLQLKVLVFHLEREEKKKLKQFCSHSACLRK